MNKIEKLKQELKEFEDWFRLGAITHAEFLIVRDGINKDITTEEVKLKGEN